MNYILTHEGICGTSYLKKLIAGMKEPCDLLAKRSANDWRLFPKGIKTSSPVNNIMSILSGNDRIINWGNHIFSRDDYFDLNRPTAIRGTSNKARSRYILQKAGIAVPRSYFWENLGECEEVNYPIIVRPSHHHAGSDFRVFLEPVSLQAFLWGKQTGTWYASEVFTKTNEYRVHVAHGKILIVHEKSFVDGDVEKTADVNTGHWQVLSWSDFNVKICQEAIKAIEIMGLDYGAVDIMYNSADGSMAICEINTDPDIDTPYTLEKYAAYFDWVIRHEFPEHFPIEGKSVFYTEILRS